MLLSIAIPVYNEEATLAEVVDQVLKVKIPRLKKEILIVDDGSQDGTPAIMEKLVTTHENIRAFKQPFNQGKGAAISRALKEARGDIIIIQDADLEYDPQDYKILLKPILDNKADVVYGSRFITAHSHRVLYYWHSVGNQFLTWFSNMMTNLNLTDMETCYKAFRKEVAKKLVIQEKRFGLEPEITAKIAKMKPTLRIYEVGISYSGRTYNEGKKINWKDGVRALWCIVKYHFI